MKRKRQTKSKSNPDARGSSLNRPPGVTEELEMQIKNYVHQNHPQVVDPALAETAGHATGFYRLPSELIISHCQRRKEQGASEEVIDAEQEYLVEYFEKCCEEHRS